MQRRLSRGAYWVVVGGLAMLVSLAVATAAYDSSHHKTVALTPADDSYEPVIGTGTGSEVLFTSIPGEVIVVTDSAVSIGMSVATLRGYLSEDGGETCEYRFEYGATVAYGSTTSWTGAISGGDTFSADITGLASSTTYHFRAQCRNSIETGSGADDTFTTYASVDAPTEFQAIPISGTEISLLWTRGSGAPQSHLRYKEGQYPAHIADGTQAYQGLSASYLLTSLTPGTTYYFTLWGLEPPSTYSPLYVTAMATTLPGVSSGEGPYTLPTGQSNWFLTPDASGLVNIPFYGSVENAASAMGISVANMFVILILVWATGIGFVAYLFSRSVIVVLAATATVILLGFVAGPLPGWIFVMYLLMAGPVGYILVNREQVT